MEKPETVFFRKGSQKWCAMTYSLRVTITRSSFRRSKRREKVNLQKHPLFKTHQGLHDGAARIFVHQEGP
jgi:hypothetical protein